MYKIHLVALGGKKNKMINFDVDFDIDKDILNKIFQEIPNDLQHSILLDTEELINRYPINDFNKICYYCYNIYNLSIICVYYIMANSNSVYINNSVFHKKCEENCKLLISELKQLSFSEIKLC